MNEGWWINYRTGKEFPIDEHEMWLRRGGNAKKLGVPRGVIEDFVNFDPKKDRNKFLLYVMARSPVIRVRGHGSSITYEMGGRNKRSILDAVWLHAARVAGPFTNLFIKNFVTSESVNVSYRDFKEFMAQGDYASVYRMVAKMTVKEDVVRELLVIAEELEGCFNSED